jgi:hypothetical protein
VDPKGVGEITTEVRGLREGLGISCSVLKNRFIKCKLT